MKILLILLAAGLISSEKLDRTYLPPPGSKLSGGSEFLQAPPGLPKQNVYPGNNLSSPGSTIVPGTVFGQRLPSSTTTPALPISGIYQRPSPTPGSNLPITYTQDFNAPTTTTTYAFTQTTTLPPIENVEATARPFNTVPTGYTTGYSQASPGQGYQFNIPGQNNIQGSPSIGTTQGPYSTQPTPGQNYQDRGNAQILQGQQYRPNIPGSNNLQSTIPTGTPPSPNFIVQPTPGQNILINDKGYQYLTPVGSSQIPNIGTQQNYGQNDLGYDNSKIIPDQRYQSVIPAVNFNSLQGTGITPTGTTQGSDFGLQSRPGQTFVGNFQTQVVPGAPSTYRQPLPSQDALGSSYGQTPSANQVFGSTQRPEFITQSPVDRKFYTTQSPNYGTTAVTSSNLPPSVYGSTQFGNDQDFTNGVSPTTILPNLIPNQQRQNLNNLAPSDTYSQNQVAGLNEQQDDDHNYNRPIFIPSNVSPAGSNINEGISGPIVPTGFPSTQFSTSTATYRPINIPSSTARPERIQADADRNAVILNYENILTPEGFAYSFDTSNGIHADESGTATDGVKAKGSYSYIGDDGKEYKVVYSADENGFQPRGDHLPTSPPIPDAILKVIEQAALEKQAGIIDDGSYDENKYGHKKYQGPGKQRQSNLLGSMTGPVVPGNDGINNQQKFGPTSEYTNNVYDGDGKLNINGNKLPDTRVISNRPLNTLPGRIQYDNAPGTYQDMSSGFIPNIPYGSTVPANIYNQGSTSAEVGNVPFTNNVQTTEASNIQTDGEPSNPLVQTSYSSQTPFTQGSLNDPGFNSPGSTTERYNYKPTSQSSQNLQQNPSDVRYVTDINQQQNNYRPGSIQQNLSGASNIPESPESGYQYNVPQRTFGSVANQPSFVGQNGEFILNQMNIPVTTAKTFFTSNEPQTIKAGQIPVTTEFIPGQFVNNFNAPTNYSPGTNYVIDATGTPQGTFDSSSTRRPFPNQQTVRPYQQYTPATQTGYSNEILPGQTASSPFPTQGFPGNTQYSTTSRPFQRRPSSGIFTTEKPYSDGTVPTPTQYTPAAVRKETYGTGYPTSQYPTSVTPGFKGSSTIASSTTPGYQSTVGEDFSGPKRPQTFDPQTGYQY